MRIIGITNTIASLLLLCLSVGAQENTDWSDFIELYNQKNINTEFTEFSPAYWNDQVVFVKSKPRQKLLDKNTNEPYFDLFLSNLNKVGSMTTAEPLSQTINSDYHEGPAVFSNDGSELFFTRVDYASGQFGFNDNKEVALKLFSSQYENGSWTKPKKENLNEDNSAMAHPALSPQNDFIVFASDRPGGYGKMDLYLSRKNGQEWSEPINLGKNINSSGNDWFPFINKRGYLFYASDGRKDARGLDVYMTELINDSWSPALRLPTPINSKHDDFGMILDASGTNGFLSSNRPGGQGKDDIYGFNSLVSLFTHYDSDYNTVKINVLDKNDKNPLPRALIKYKSLEQSEFETFDQEIFSMDSGGAIDSLYTDDNGKAKFNINEGYTLLEITFPYKEKWTLVMSNHGSKKNIDVLMKDKITPATPEPEIVYIEKTSPAAPVIKNVAVDVGSVIVFENIYYDYNSYILTTGAKKELDILAELMAKNPNLKIQLSAHTDSRGDAEYNLSLSQKRANSAKDYLVSKGIPYINITSVGYGELQLRNHCKDGTFCTEAEHIYNRRTEVKILQL